MKNGTKDEAMEGLGDERMEAEGQAAQRVPGWESKERETGKGGRMKQRAGGTEQGER